jgi:hypothetical protein
MRVSATRTLPAQSDVSAPRPARGAALNARSRLGFASVTITTDTYQCDHPTHPREIPLATIVASR